MFGHRTPTKPTNNSVSPSKVKPASQVRRSIDEWESANTDPTPPLTQTTKQAGPVNKTKLSSPRISGNVTIGGESASVTPPSRSSLDRVAEARLYLKKGKLNLSSSRNIKTEIKSGLTEVLDKLFQLVKEAEAELRGCRGKEEVGKKEIGEKELTTFSGDPSLGSQLTKQLAEHSLLLTENTKRLVDLQYKIEHLQGGSEVETYASIASKSPVQRATLHSVVITSKDETETGEEVLDRVRKAVDAKEGWVKVQKVRKAKDRKVVMGFQSIEERDKVKERLETKAVDLTVEMVKNKNPLLILKDVLKYNSDADIITALKNQNREIFHHLNGEEVVIRYRKRARNPHANHVVISVPPLCWKKATGAGFLHVDLQRVRVEDQSPLIQCTRCLEFGHGKRLCKESVDICSHCGGPHLRAECAEWIAHSGPTCRNCSKAKMENACHNAFSTECPIRKRWDTIARSTVAYC